MVTFLVPPANKRVGELADYWIYENWSASKAVVHRADCPFCKNGSGVRVNKEEGRNGKWHGSFKSYQQAFSHASSLGRKTKTCALCKPSSS